MSLKTNFVCGKCGRKMTWWEIFKLSCGYQAEIKKFECFCGNILKFRINLLMMVLTIIIGATIFLFPKTLFFILGWFILSSFTVFLYYANIKKIGEEFHKPV